MVWFRIAANNEMVLLISSLLCTTRFNSFLTCLTFLLLNRRIDVKTILKRSRVAKPRYQLLNMVTALERNCNLILASLALNTPSNKPNVPLISRNVNARAVPASSSSSAGSRKTPGWARCKPGGRDVGVDQDNACQPSVFDPGRRVWDRFRLVQRLCNPIFALF